MLTHHGRRILLEHMVGWQEYPPPSEGLWAGFIITDPDGATEDYQYGNVLEMEENSWEGRQRIYFRGYEEGEYGVINDDAAIFTTTAGTTYAIGLWDQENGGQLVSYQILDEPLVTTEGQVVAFNHRKIVQSIDVIV